MSGSQTKAPGFAGGYLLIAFIAMSLLQQNNKDASKIIGLEIFGLKAAYADSQTIDKESVKRLLENQRTPANEIKQYGPQVIPILTNIYSEADSNRDKARIASLFWRLGWQSEEIERALVTDLDTDDPGLKVQVQWGLARSTQNSEIIDKILFNLENDTNAFVRDKAACALASDFIHISPIQRVALLRGLINGLENEIFQVRNSSIKALKIQTGQTKRFVANDTAENRAKLVDEWRNWLAEYERNL